MTIRSLSSFPLAFNFALPRSHSLTSRYPGFSRAGPLPSSRSAPSSHPAPNPGAKSFLITFETAEQAKGAVSETKAYLMQPGWEMGVSVDQ